jgi:adenine-specific DNA-methyltransferase
VTVTSLVATDDLSPSTRAWLASAAQADRKTLGQYMTPRAVRERLLDNLPLFPGMRVLDPGVGTGEFLRSVLDREPTAKVHGWDVDPSILERAAELVPEAELVERSALTPYLGEPFDLVVGNPPYFQFRAPIEVKRHFAQVISGRPNIFALFFQAGMDALSEDGRLAYVVPPSMNNGAYFEALREFIVSRSAIDHLEVLDDKDLFADANTAVQLIVMRHGARGDGFILTRECRESGFRRTIFAQRPELLEAEFEGRRTLADLGYHAVTGTVVWNQNRDRLRRESSDESVPLVWAHNIRGGAIVLDDDHAKRPQYVVPERGWVEGPAIVVNRIVGSVGSAELRCGLVADGVRFVGENHVNVVRRLRDREASVSWDDLLRLLQAPEVARRIKLLTGNTQVSATELTYLVPLG